MGSHVRVRGRHIRQGKRPREEPEPVPEPPKEPPELAYFGHSGSWPPASPWDSQRGEDGVLVLRKGLVVGPLPHVIRHSPQGFAWGYTGSGPSDLARCLLIHALGEEAVCPDCSTLYDRIWSDPADLSHVWAVTHGYPLADWESIGTCEACLDGASRLVDENYQAFKEEVVAHLEAPWLLDRDDVVAWTRARSSE